MSNGTEPQPAGAPTPSPLPRSYLFGVEPALARRILAAGVVLFLLVSFVEKGAQRKLAVKQCKLAALRAQIDAPAPPIEPDAPREDDYKDKKEKLDEAKKEYDKQKKKYDEKLKDYKDDYVEWLEDAYDRKVDRAELERDVNKMQIEMDDWGYFRFFLRFLASLAIVFGLAHALFHGSDIERAAAIFLLGMLATQLL